LGGSLITDKNRPLTHRPDVLSRLAVEIRAARQSALSGDLILGHGSGSFGHTAAKKYATRNGVYTPQGWQGFAEVWQSARALNQHVCEALAQAGLPVIAFPPSAGVTASDGQVFSWDLTPLRAALLAGLLPVLNGDVVFDNQRGGTILSTEEVFFDLAKTLQPQRILLAGLEPGVWVDFPKRTRILPLITPDNFTEIEPALQGSAAADVTGGMIQKVKSMLDLVQRLPALEVLVFSGEEPGNVREALLGACPGTLIRAHK